MNLNLIKKTGATLVLALLAVLGNYFNLSLFFGLDLVFGSVAAMMAVVLLGWLPGLLVALAGGAYTWLLWGHPYAMVIFGVEALAVAWLMRRATHLALADALYWLFAGAPLVWLFYSGVLGLNSDATTLVMLKQMVNGILNALLAAFAIQALRAFKPALTGVQGHGISVRSLLFNAFLAVGMAAGMASLVVYSNNAATDLHRDAGAGLDNAARRVVRYLEREGTSPPEVINAVALDEDIHLLLLSPLNEVLAQRGDMRSRQPGTFADLGEAHSGLRMWLPEGKMALVARWRRGYYALELPAVGRAGNRLIIERAAAPSVIRIERGRLDLLSLMALISLLSVTAAWLLSRWLAQPIVEIGSLSRSLTARIMAGQAGSLGGSRVREFNEVRQSLQVMADTMARSFREVQEARASLAQQVQERTQTLQQSKQLLDSIIEHFPAMVFLKRARDLRFEMLNRAGEKLLGYSRQELLGKSDYDFFPIAQAEAFVQRDREVLVSGQVLEIPEEPITTASGQTRYLHTLKIGLRDDNGVPTHLLGISLDITERRESERALDEFKSTLDRTLDSVLMLDARNHQFFYANQGALDLLGYSRDELLQMHPYDLVPGQSARVFGAQMAPLLYGERNAMTYEADFQRKNGKMLPVEVFVQYLAGSGQRARFVFIVRDMAERKRVEQLKSEFVSTVSHELRTPLTSIAGALGLAMGGALGELPPQLRQMLDMAYKNSQRLTSLINDLLDMEKLAAGKMQFDLRTQPLMPLVEHAIESTQAYAQQYQVRCVLTERMDEAQVQVDGSRLQQVLANFLSNAAKFSPRDSQVDVAVRHHSGRVRVEVRDRGPGIAAQFRGRIFQKFSQADSSDTREKGGTGLGLAISKELIERMQGAVGFESEEGHGSCFYFELPLENTVNLA